MGRIGKLLSFVRTLRHGAQVSDVKLDPGGGANITSEHFAGAGDDAFPLVTDYPIAVDLQRQGVAAVVGYVDPINEPKSLEGEKRIYARDPATGLVIVEVWLKNDGEATIFNDTGSSTILPSGEITAQNPNGSIKLRSDGGSIVTTPLSTFDCDADGSVAATNGSGSYELATNGDFLVNGVKIAANGIITMVGGVILDTHIHSQGSDGGGDAEVDVGVPHN